MKLKIVTLLFSFCTLCPFFLFSQSATVLERNSNNTKEDIYQEKKKLNLPTPTNLTCTRSGPQNEIVTLSWSRLPGPPTSTFYEVTLGVSPNFCPNANEIMTPIVYFTNDPFLELNASEASRNFAWNVKAYLGPYNTVSNLACFTPETPCLSIGLKQQANTELLNVSTAKPSIGPNPNQGSFTITWKVPNLKLLSISIFTIDGKRVHYYKEKNVLKGIFKHEVRLQDNLPEGMYFLSIASENKTIQEKIILKR